MCQKQLFVKFLTAFVIVLTLSIIETNGVLAQSNSIKPKGIGLLSSLLGLQETHQGEFLNPDEAFRIDMHMEDAQHIKVRFTIADGYHLYRSRTPFRAEPVALAPFELPRGKKKNYGEAFGDLELYQGVVDISLPLQPSEVGSNMVNVHAIYQGCADKGLCYSPITKKISLNLPKDFIEQP